MSGLFPIIIVIIFVMIIRSVAKNAKPSSRSRNPNNGGQSLGDILQQAVRSASNEKWMAAAGALQARYVRPVQGKAPEIEGERNDLKFKVFLAYPNANNVSCRILFPQNIDKDLLIVHERNDQLSKFFKNKPVFRNTGLENRHIGASALDEQWFREYLAQNDRANVINGMTQYLQSFQINDTGITAVFEDKQNSPDIYLVQVLLADSEALLPDPLAGDVPLVSESEAAPEVYTWEEDVQPEEIVTPQPEPEVVIPEVAEPRAVQPEQTAPSLPPMPEVAAPKAVTTVPMPRVSEPKKVFSATPAAKTAAVSAPAPETAGEVSLEQQAFCEMLFQKNIIGKTEKDLFAAVVGQQVEWQGKLLSSYDFTFDFAFGNRKGVKASFLLCEVTGSSSLKQKVKAHVAFPIESSDTLKQMRDQQLTFRGTLLKMEGFSREIYIDNGELL